MTKRVTKRSAVALVIACLGTSSTQASGLYNVELGSWHTEADAQRHISDVVALHAERSFTTNIKEIQEDGTVSYYGYVGVFPDRAEAQALCDSLKSSAYQCMPVKN